MLLSFIFEVRERAYESGYCGTEGHSPAGRKGVGPETGFQQCSGQETHSRPSYTTGRFSPKLMEMFIVKKKCKDVKYVS